MKTKKDKILEKLRKLMNLKESATALGNEGEANAAAAGITRLLIGLVCTMLMKESLIWARYCRNMNLEKLLPLRKVIWMLTDFIEKGKMQLT